MNTENKMINGLGQEEQRVQNDSCEEQRAIQPHTRCCKTGICNSVSQHPDVSVMPSAKAISTTRNALWACWLGEQSEDGLNTSTPLSQIFFFFFSAGCHYPAALFSLLLLSCSVCCYLTQISTDCICFCWKFFKISYDDKILFCVLKSEYQTVGS